MRKTVKVVMELDTDEMDILLVDMKHHLFGINNLWVKHGLHSIKVTVTGLDPGEDPRRGTLEKCTQLKR